MYIRGEESDETLVAWHGVIWAFHHACVSQPAPSGIHVWHGTSDGLRPRHRGGEERSLDGPEQNQKEQSGKHIAGVYMLEA
jgi:hypothetical protein